jgi:hypothetical protein
MAESTSGCDKSVSQVRWHHGCFIHYGFRPSAECTKGSRRLGVPTVNGHGENISVTGKYQGSGVVQFPDLGKKMKPFVGAVVQWIGAVEMSVPQKPHQERDCMVRGPTACTNNKANMVDAHDNFVGSHINL